MRSPIGSERQARDPIQLHKVLAEKFNHHYPAIKRQRHRGPSGPALRSARSPRSSASPPSRSRSSTTRRHREAQRACGLFQGAAEEERVTAELVRDVVAYLDRASRNPQLHHAAI